MAGLLLATIGAAPCLAIPVQSTPGNSGNACDNAHAEVKAILVNMSSDIQTVAGNESEYVANLEKAAAKMRSCGSFLGLEKRGSNGTCINLCRSEVRSPKLSRM